MSALFFARKPEGDLELEFLRTEFSDAQRDLQAAYNQFNLAVEPELVEACIYQINAIVSEVCSSSEMPFAVCVTYWFPSDFAVT